MGHYGGINIKTGESLAEGMRIWIDEIFDVEPEFVALLFAGSHEFGLRLLR